jgi:hypothetical protein
MRQQSDVCLRVNTPTPKIGSNEDDEIETTISTKKPGPDAIPNPRRMLGSSTSRGELKYGVTSVSISSSMVFYWTAIPAYL